MRMQNLQFMSKISKKLPHRISFLGKVASSRKKWLHKTPLFALVLAFGTLGAWAYSSYDDTTVNDSDKTHEPFSEEIKQEKRKNNVTPTNPAEKSKGDTSSHSTQPRPTADSSYRPFECKNIPILREIDYRDNDAMSKDQTKLVFEGMDGYYVECSTDSDGYTPPSNGTRIEPVNDVVERGTGIDEQKRIQEAQALAERNQRYTLNLANCIQNMQSQGATQATADRLCRQAVRY